MDNFTYIMNKMIGADYKSAPTGKGTDYKPERGVEVRRVIISAAKPSPLPPTSTCRFTALDGRPYRRSQLQSKPNPNRVPNPVRV